ncbi:MAG: hypothetical protein LBU77_04445, partial [Clostridiales bacterium]|nr:hypothetical protein [Clostridiales bacterium]
MALSNNMQVSEQMHAIFPQYKEGKNMMNRFSGEIGAVLNAVVVGKDERTTTVKTGEDLLLRLSGEQVRAEIGDEVYFEVVSADKDGVALKQIDNPYTKNQPNRLQAKKQTDLLNLKELMQKADFIQPEDTVAPETVSEFNNRRAAETTEALKRVKRRLAYAPETVSRGIVAELTACGVPLEKISMRVMDAAMKAAADVHAAGETPQKRKEIETTVKRKLKDIGELSDEAVAKLIKSGQPVTIESVYVAKHSTTSGEPAENKEMLKTLMPIIKKTMAREGISETPEQTALAKLFVRSEIPI